LEGKERVRKKREELFPPDDGERKKKERRGEERRGEERRGEERRAE
jgi:hypothetical protein